MSRLHSCQQSAIATARPELVPAAYRLPFVLLTVCFAAWGLANNMTDPLVKVFLFCFVVVVGFARFDLRQFRP